MRTDISLSVVDEDGKPKVVEGTKGRVLKKSGKILTLTGQGAVDCGLALGTASSIEQCLSLLGFDSSKQVGQAAAAICQRRKQDVERAAREYNLCLKEAVDLYEQALAIQKLKAPKPQPGILLRDFAAEEAAAKLRSTYVANLRAAKSRLERADAVTKRYPLLLNGQLKDLASEARLLAELAKRRLESGRTPDVKAEQKTIREIRNKLLP